MVTVDIEGYISREAVMACVSPCLFERSLMFKGCRTFSASWRIGSMTLAWLRQIAR
jgi:hypothetical protein